MSSVHSDDELQGSVGPNYGLNTGDIGFSNDNLGLQIPGTPLQKGGVSTTSVNSTSWRSKQSTQESLVGEYHKIWGWVVFTIVTVTLFAIFLPFIIKSVKIQKINGTERLFNLNVKRNGFEELAAQSYLDFQKTIAFLNATAPEKIPNATLAFQQQVAMTTEIVTRELLAEKTEIQADSDEIFKYWLGLGLFCLISQLASASIIFVKRHHPLIKSKSVYFWAHYITFSILNVTSAILFIAYLLLQYPITDDYANVGVGLFILLSFTSFGYLSSLVCRMDLIYKIFHFQGEVKAYIYFRTIPLHVLLFLIATIPTIWPILYYSDDRNVFQSSAGHDWAYIFMVAITGLIYPVWISFYTFNLRHVSQKYSDFYCNVRCVLYFGILSSIYFLMFLFSPNSALPTFLLFLSTSTTCLYYYADVIMCMFFVDYKMNRMGNLLSVSKDDMSKSSGMVPSASASSLSTNKNATPVAAKVA